MILDFFIAKQKHRMWMINMKAYLLGVEDFKAENIAKHTDCDLGKWIYGFAINEFKGNVHFDELERIHQDLHRTIVEIINMKEAGRIDDANTSFNSLEAISTRILTLLDEMEKQQAA
jgi:methyl-accepting chemotaxis protein